MLEKTINLSPLHKSIEALGIPIESVVIGKPDDRSTWRIVFCKEATEEQRKTAQTMLDAFDPNTKDASNASMLLDQQSIEHIRAYLVGTEAEKQTAIAELVKIQEEATAGFLKKERGGTCKGD